jgi:hypothetical protein
VPVRWEGEEFSYVPITGISAEAPVRITAPSHGIPPGWRVLVVSVEGMTEINAPEDFKDRDFRIATVVDADEVKLNAVNAAQFTAYSSGGYLQFYTPVDLNDYPSARMSVKTEVGGSQLLSLTTENGGIEIDAATSTITIVVTAAQTAALAEGTAVYDLEMISSDGDVVSPLHGDIVITPEVTT